MIIFLLAGLTLLAVGLAVSLLFWWPRLVDRRKLRELLGRRYPLVYLFYTANGPLLVAAGILLLLKYFRYI
ncbi:MAG TPA: hypothetical protein VLA15_01125 [Desulfurivibrionaceae bacterium]|nr:hypothetical protein [Desulfurivibrionaceae bacterium]